MHIVHVPSKIIIKKSKKTMLRVYILVDSAYTLFRGYSQSLLPFISHIIELLNFACSHQVYTFDLFLLPLIPLCVLSIVAASPHIHLFRLLSLLSPINLTFS